MKDQRSSRTFKSIELLSECYANNCLASKLSEILRKRTDYAIRVLHNYKYGRDRIIKEILKRSPTRQLIIAIIDYERGISRVYIDIHFKLKEVEKHIFIGVSKHKPNTMAIVFDPDIESAFLCRISKELCINSLKLKRVKSSNACKIVERLIEKNSEGKRILYKLIDEILNEPLNLIYRL